MTGSPRIRGAWLAVPAMLALLLAWSGASAQEPIPTATATGAPSPTVIATASPTSTATATATPKAIPSNAPYFSLGDSLADAEGATSHDTGYVALFATQAWPILKLPGSPAHRGEFGLRGGETTTSMLAPGGQLDRATGEIRLRNSDGYPSNDVRLITIDIGGNDFRALTRSSSPCRVSVVSPECQQAVLDVTQAFNTNYPIILQRIREAAGPDAIIIAMAFYNPFSGTGDAVDAPGDLAVAPINDAARAVAVSPAVKAVWVDLFTLFKGKAPELTHIMDADSNIHPNDAGYALIASAMTEALRAAVAPPPSPPDVGNSPAGGEAPRLWLWVGIVVIIAATASGAWTAGARAAAVRHRTAVLLPTLFGVVAVLPVITAALSADDELSDRLVVPMVARDEPDTRVYLPTATPVPAVYPPVQPCRVSPSHPETDGRILHAWVVEDDADSVLIAVDYEWNDPVSPICVAVYLFDAPFPGGTGRGTAGQWPMVPPASKGTVLIRARCNELVFQGVGGGAYFAAGFFTNAAPFHRVPVAGIDAPPRVCL